MFLDFGAKALKAQNLMSETLPFLGTHFACIIVMTGDICAVRRPSVKGEGWRKRAIRQFLQLRNAASSCISI